LLLVTERQSRRRLREQKPVRDFLVDLKRDAPSLLRVVTREQNVSRRSAAAASTCLES